MCPMDFVKDAPCTEYGADLPQALAADGRPLRRYGRQHITFYTYNGQTIIANFEVLDVTGPSMAVGKLQERGYVALFGAQSNVGDRINEDTFSHDWWSLLSSSGDHFKCSLGQPSTRSHDSCKCTSFEN